MKSKYSTSLTAFLVFFSISFCAHSQCSITSNLVTNGNFESGNTSFSSSYGYNPGNLNPEGKYDINTNPRNTHTNFAICGDHTTGSGNMMVVNGASVAGVTVWCGTVAVATNSTYTFSTWVASVHPSSPAILQFSINGVNLGSTFTASSTTCNWQQFCEMWSSGSNTSANICIVNQNTAAAGNDFALDDIQMGISTVLPVQLASFTAQKFQNEILINWQSTSEINHQYYVVQKSTDLQHWQDIQKIIGTGNKNTKADYQYIDNSHLTQSTIYYRIKSVDNEGNEEFSPAKNVSLTVDEITLAPNPTYDKLHILGAVDVADVSVYNSQELLVKKQTFSSPPSAIEIDVSDLNASIYIIVIINTDGNKIAKRLVKR